jgi:hypothetical protein
VLCCNQQEENQAGDVGQEGGRAELPDEPRDLGPIGHDRWRVDRRAGRGRMGGRMGVRCRCSGRRGEVVGGEGAEQVVEESGRLARIPPAPCLSREWFLS